ncbi:hypothetical protein V2J09_017529 [Rumex salicifolius]
MVKLCCLIFLLLLDVAIVNGSAEAPKNGDIHIHVVDKNPHSNSGGHGRHMQMIDGHGHDDDDDGIYELKTHYMDANFTNWGATLMSLYLPDMHGQMADVVLGYNSVDDYKKGKAYMGATVGRVANRIKGAQFSINEKHYKLQPNEGRNLLHGGRRGFSNVTWKVEKYDPKGQTPSITFAYESPDGDQGFPGALSVKTTYTLDDKENTLTIQMTAALHGDAAADTETPVNLANHAYWNLGGHSSGTVLFHRLQINSTHVTPVADDLIPTGDFSDIWGSAYDFLVPRSIASKMGGGGFPDGYDINYVLDRADADSADDPTRLHVAAVLEDQDSGRKMELLTNQVGMQLYTGGKLENLAGKDGAVYGKFGGVCLETQGFPDAVNNRHFPDQILGKGDEYKHVMLFRFSTAFSDIAVQ